MNTTTIVSQTGTGPIKGLDIASLPHDVTQRIVKAALAVAIMIDNVDNLRLPLRRNLHDASRSRYLC